MTTKTIRSFVIAATTALILGAPARAEPSDYADPARGYSMKVPEGWSSPAAGGVTTSADGAVQCTVTTQAVPQTATQSQEQVNAAMQAYTPDIWRQRFFTGGVTGTVETAGITKMEQFDAPWARGRMAYPNGVEVKFGVLLISAPGRLATVTCLSDPGAYDKNLAGITTVLNWLRPL
jgi:hypothetical protein